MMNLSLPLHPDAFGCEPEANIAAMESLVREAAARGAHYVQTPEMTGAVQRDGRDCSSILKTEADDAVLARLPRSGAELGISCISVLRRVKAVTAWQPIVAWCSVLTAWRLRIMTRSTCSTSISTMAKAGGKAPFISPATSPGPWTIDGARLGMGICYDIRFPHLFRDLALAGADILTAPAAFTRQTGEAHWHVLQRARAIENGALWFRQRRAAYMRTDARPMAIQSLSIPGDRVIAEADNDEPGVIVATLSLDEVKAARGKIPNLKNARRLSGLKPGLRRKGRKSGMIRSICIATRITSSRHGFPRARI
jgi:predicted amidohydrolase